MRQPSGARGSFEAGRVTRQGTLDGHDATLFGGGLAVRKYTNMQRRRRDHGITAVIRIVHGDRRERVLLAGLVRSRTNFARAADVERKRETVSRPRKPAHETH